MNLDEAISFSQRAKESNLADETGEILADDGIQAALDYANKEWKDKVLNIIKILLISHKHITADDVCFLMEEWEIEMKHPNALGGLFRTAARRNWCRKTGNFISSKIPRKHSRPLQVWESKLYG